MPSAPSTRSLLHTVAKLHYLQDMPQVEISRLLQLSTATVSRLLKRAREDGIVRIEVRDPELGHEVGLRLAAALGLKQAIVIDAPVGAASMACLAEPVGQVLEAAGLTPHSVVGLGWGRTVCRAAAASTSRRRSIR
jgi:DNA-binding transcriptional regulator LsrR (DeoR family)